jgi:hypothetical protein
MEGEIKIKVVNGITIGKLEQHDIDIVCQKCKPILLQLEECMKEFMPYEQYSSMAFYHMDGKFQVNSVPFPIKIDTPITG